MDSGRYQQNSSDDASNAKSDPGPDYYNWQPRRVRSRPSRTVYADVSRGPRSPLNGREQELSPRQTPRASLASPPVHVNNTSLDVDGGGVPNPFPEIQAIEASLDNNIDVEKVSPMHSIDGDVENNDKAVNPKRCKLPPFTPWWCISHPRLCVAVYTTLTTLLVLVFLLIAAGMFTWGFRLMSRERNVELSAQETSSLNPNNYGQFYDRVCFHWPVLQVNLFIGRAECSKAFSNASLIHSTPIPIPDSLNLFNGYNGLMFYWLESTVINLGVTAENSVSSFHLLQDKAVSGQGSLRDRCGELRDSKGDATIVKRSYPLSTTTNNSEVGCTELSNGSVQCDIQILLNDTSHYYLCFTSDEKQTTINYILDMSGPTLDFDSFEQITECRNEVCCMDYEESILIELAHPNCIFIQTNTSAKVDYELLYGLENFTEELRTDIFWLLTIAMVLIAVVELVATAMLISVCCKLRNQDLKGCTCTRLCEWKQYSEYEQLPN